MSHYGTVEDFISYHELRGREIPAAWQDDDNAVIKAALLVASEWLDGKYGSSFVGEKTDGFLQTREWPRRNAFTNTCPTYYFATDEIPERVIQATYEAAFRQATNPGVLLVDFTPGKYRSVSISGAVSVEYANFTFASEVQTQIAAIDMLLSPLLLPSAGASIYSGDTVRA